MMPFKVTNASQYANTSPSVSLERGGYRMRAPVARPLPLLLQAQGSPVRHSAVHHRVNRNLAFLLSLLTLACITCFGCAYYLFTTRWELRPVSVPSTQANSTSQANVSMSIETVTRLGSNEKFLSYLPHSGFHNQRIAFENALLLSYVLRRTLLVPPIRLGNKPIRYVDFGTLSRYHDLSGKEGLSHCPRVAPYISRPSECLQYFEFTYVPWSWLVNLSALAIHQPLVHRPSMSQAWIRENTGVGPSETYTLRDTSAYQFRFLDTASDSSPPKDRYLHDIYIDDLAAVQERLLQIGTLFGSSRSRLKNSDNRAYRGIIRQTMLFSNKDLTYAAEAIARSLKGSYIAVHLRSGDGHFKSKVENTVKAVWWKVLRDVLGFEASAKCDLERKFSGDTSQECIPDTSCINGTRNRSLTPQPSIASLSSKLQCRSKRHYEQRYHLLNIPLYVATDLPNPESHPQLSILRQSFPCIFFLGDFPAEVRELEQLRSPYDEVNLHPFLLPFVDALVAGKALRVVGTEGSTFSGFVEDILWTSHHGFPINQRG